MFSFSFSVLETNQKGNRESGSEKSSKIYRSPKMVFHVEEGLEGLKITKANRHDRAVFD